MKTSIFMMTLLLTLYSCKGPANSKKEDNDPMGNRGMEDVPERNYNASELSIGRRICANLKLKTALYDEVVSSGKKLHFSGEMTSCGSQTVNTLGEYQVGMEYSGGNYQYVAARTNYIRDPLTETSGYMKEICDALASSDSVSNTILDGKNTVAVKFLIDDSYDQVQFIVKKDGLIVIREAVFVFTKAPNQTSTRYLGLEKDRVRYTLCPDKKNTSYLRQIWRRESN